MATGHRASTPATSGSRRPAVTDGPSRRPASASAVGHRTVWSLVFWLLVLGGVYVAATRLDPSRLTGLRQAAQEARASAPVSIRPDAPMRKVAPTERPASVSDSTAEEAGSAPVFIAPPSPASGPSTGSTALALTEPAAASTPERLEAAPAVKAGPPPSDTIYKCVEGGRVSFSQGLPCAGKAQRVELASPPSRRSGASAP